MTEEEIPPLRISVDVACSAEHAFHVWTARIAAWWPVGHRATDEAGTEVVLEPRLGGRLLERTSSGREVQWGEITAWEPPHRLAYRWHIRRDPADATEVEIRFVAVEPGAARVDIVHLGWERLGAAGPDWRERNLGGWNGVLPEFLRAALSGDPGPS
ncbi:SRPBCC domain-containing protein [uncultured Amnibacterium sp.]|uniref:SRPBCC domain-containing protein n=1 Tax=uncultured Amnibacterium sp. TaxID=1631851 RepID=UPI0035CA25C4